MEAALDITQLYAPKKLDIGAGINPGPIMRNKDGSYKVDASGKPIREKGWTGIDLEPNSDIVWDLFRYPWPIATGSVARINIAHFVEHIPHYRPEWGAKDGWFVFWEEVARITKRNARIEVIHPFGMHSRAFWDPTHVRFIVPQTWFYLDAEWRKANDLGHYTDVDFEVQIAYAGIEPEFMGRNEEFIEFHRNHSWNVVPDLAVTLTRR